MNDAPEHVIAAESTVMDWGTRNPVDCARYDHGDLTVRKTDLEIQYHTGAYTAAVGTLRALYTIERIDRKHLIPDSPPWLEDANESRRQLLDGGDACDE